MTVDELKDLLALVELQVKITLMEDNDEECGDMYEELDFLIACLLKKGQPDDDNKENEKVATKNVEMIE